MKKRKKEGIKEEKIRIKVKSIRRKKRMKINKDRKEGKGSNEML